MMTWGFTSEARQNKLIDTYGRTEEEWDRHTLSGRYPRGAPQLNPETMEHKRALDMLRDMKEAHWPRTEQQQAEEPARDQKKRGRNDTNRHES
jgi:hypothetical protein